jgi:hypothetical protein
MGVMIWAGVRNLNLNFGGKIQCHWEWKWLYPWRLKLIVRMALLNHWCHLWSIHNPCLEDIHHNRYANIQSSCLICTLETWLENLVSSSRWSVIYSHSFSLKLLKFTWVWAHSSNFPLYF